MYDVAIIGAGVVGSAIARELSRYEVKACVIEREEDVCSGTSKANSAIIHAGFDAVPGTRKAKLNVRGNAMMDELAEELDIPFIRNGSLVVCTKEQDEVISVSGNTCPRGDAYARKEVAAPVHIGDLPDYSIISYTFPFTKIRSARVMVLWSSPLLTSRITL